MITPVSSSVALTCTEAPDLIRVVEQSGEKNDIFTIAAGVVKSHPEASSVSPSSLLQEHGCHRVWPATVQALFYEITITVVSHSFFIVCKWMLYMAFVPNPSTNTPLLSRSEPSISFSYIKQLTGIRRALTLIFSVSEHARYFWRVQFL